MLNKSELLSNSFEKINIQLTELQINQFIKYYEMIVEKNKVMNLTAITERYEFIKKHFIDSLCCLPHEEYKQSENVIDVGTGAGFPGMPLAIVSTDKKFLLVDSLPHLSDLPVCCSRQLHHVCSICL